LCYRRVVKTKACEKQEDETESAMHANTLTDKPEKEDNLGDFLIINLSTFLFKSFRDQLLSFSAVGEPC
jgi:hypothetical protein